MELQISKMVRGWNCSSACNPGNSGKLETFPFGILWLLSAGAVGSSFWLTGRAMVPRIAPGFPGPSSWTPPWSGPLRPPLPLVVRQVVSVEGGGGAVMLPQRVCMFCVCVYVCVWEWLWVCFWPCRQDLLHSCSSSVQGYCPYH